MPRTTPARADLAAAHLKGKVKAARYVEASLRLVADSSVPLHTAPRPDAPLVTEALYGDKLAQLVDGGFLTLDSDRLAATAAGRQRLNAVLAALLC